MGRFGLDLSSGQSGYKKKKKRIEMGDVYGKNVRTPRLFNYINIEYTFYKII